MQQVTRAGSEVLFRMSDGRELEGSRAVWSLLFYLLASSPVLTRFLGMVVANPSFEVVFKKVMILLGY